MFDIGQESTRITLNLQHYVLSESTAGPRVVSGDKGQHKDSSAFRAQSLSPRLLVLSAYIYTANILRELISSYQAVHL